MKSLEVSYPGLALVILTPILSSFVYGVDIGLTSFVLSMLRDPNNEDADAWWSSMASDHMGQGIFLSSMSLGALIGSHTLLVYLAHFISRRTEIRIALCLFFIGNIFNFSSGTILQRCPKWIGFSCLLLGRLLFGFGVGFVQHSSCIYMSEMCPANIRGAVVASKEASIVFGIIAGYAIGDLFSENPLEWANLYLSSVFLTIPLLVMSSIMPRSSRWLLANGEVNEAKQSLQFIYKDDVHEIFNFLQKEVTKTINCPGKERQKPNSFFKILYLASPKAITASVGLVVLQQFSGQPSLISYVTILFSSVGLSGDFSVWTAILMAFAALFTVCMVDRLGRKILLETGCFLMFVALVALSLSFWNFRANETDPTSYFPPSQQVVVALSLLIYIASYQLCFGPLTWLIVSEVFPVDIRGEATAFLVELNYCLNFLVQFLVPSVQVYIGWSTTFSFFAFILLLALFFINSYVPETKGLTLEAIEKDLQEKNVTSRSESEKSLLRMRVRSFDSFKTFEHIDHTSSALCP